MSALRPLLTGDERRALELLEEAARALAMMDDAVSLEHMRMIMQSVESIKAVLVARVLNRLYPEGML